MSLQVDSLGSNENKLVRNFRLCRLAYTDKTFFFQKDNQEVVLLSRDCMVCSSFTAYSMMNRCLGKHPCSCQVREHYTLFPLYFLLIFFALPIYSKGTSFLFTSYPRGK